MLHQILDVFLVIIVIAGIVIGAVCFLATLGGIFEIIETLCDKYRRDDLPQALLATGIFFLVTAICLGSSFFAWFHL